MNNYRALQLAWQLRHYKAERCDIEGMKRTWKRALKVFAPNVRVEWEMNRNRRMNCIVGVWLFEAKPVGNPKYMPKVDRKKPLTPWVPKP